jgi:death-on-curing protein
MSEPVWVNVALAIDIHSEQLSLFGGPAGLRDRALLESALARAQNKFAYGETDLAVLAAACAFGVARNHPFVDGNKRAAFGCMIVFLGLNGIDLDVEPAMAAAAILALAAGEVDEDGLTRWLRDNWPKDAPA